MRIFVFLVAIATLGLAKQAEAASVISFKEVLPVENFKWTKSSFQANESRTGYDAWLGGGGKLTVVAEGDFDGKVPVATNDEHGDIFLNGNNLGKIGNTGVNSPSYSFTTVFDLTSSQLSALLGSGTVTFGLQNTKFVGAGKLSAITLTYNTVPEPMSFAIFGLGAVGLACLKRKRKFVA